MDVKSLETEIRRNRLRILHLARQTITMKLAGLEDEEFAKFLYLAFNSLKLSDSKMAKDTNQNVTAVRQMYCPPGYEYFRTCPNERRIKLTTWIVNEITRELDELQTVALSTETFNNERSL